MDRVIRLLTIEEAAERLNIRADAVLRCFLGGKLTSSKIDGRCPVSEMQLDFFRQSHPGELLHQDVVQPRADATAFPLL